MKLVGKLKEKVNKAETKEQAKEIIADAGMELTDEEMNKVAGGQSRIDEDIRKALANKYVVAEGANQKISLNGGATRMECNGPEKIRAVLGEDG